MKLIHRMKLLMAVVQEMGGRLTTSDLQAYLFLYCHEFVEHNHYYDFIPQIQGAHSLQVDADKTTLVAKGCLEKSGEWIAKEGMTRFAVELDFFEKIAIQTMKNTWQGKEGGDMHTYLKEHYPTFFTDLVRTVSTPGGDTIFYTIGYEGVSLETYLNKLIANDVRLLCDVRKNAFSQKYGFSRGELQSALGRVGIAYRHIPDLGIVSEKRRELATDADYRQLFDEYERETLAQQQDKLEELRLLLEEHKRIAITCFEASVHHCHRSRVARALGQREGFEYAIRHL